MFRRTALAVVVASEVCLLAPRALEAQRATGWTVTQATDPGSGEPVVTAEVETRSAADPTHIFRFTLRCSPSTNLRVGPPNAFRVGIEALRETADGPPAERSLPWPEDRASGPRALTVGYQMDGGGVHPADFGYAAANRGAIRGMVFLTLPATRLVLHGVSPGETVEVPFASLTADDRARVTAACIPPGREAIFSVGPGIPPPTRTKYVSPVYPPSAQHSGIQGQVLVAAVIGPDGTITDAKVLRGLSADLDAEALRTVRRWQFTPTRFDGVPISLNLTAMVTFTGG